MNKKSILKYIITVVLTVILTLSTSFLLLGGDFSRIFEQIALMRKLTTIDSKVNRNAVYFDSDKNDVSETLAESYVEMIDDDYAMYLDNETLDIKNDEREGISNESIGITIAKTDGEDYPIICYVNRDAPAEKAGVKQWDILIEINGVDLKDKTTAQVAEIIKENEKADIVVERDDEKLSFSIEPDEYIRDSVIWRMINKTCVIKITRFEESTVTQFDEAMEFANDNNAESIIFDLRNNPGGYVDSCAEILDKICPEGDLVRMKFKSGETKVKFKSDKDEIDLKVAVITNGNTASAAEIFALNIREFDKGKLIGETTFGKGIAQTTYEIGDGTAIKFTTATIVDKNGVTYHKKGLIPDIEVKFTDEQNENYLFLSDDEDTQLQKALEIIK